MEQAKEAAGVGRTGGGNQPPGWQTLPLDGTSLRTVGLGRTVHMATSQLSLEISSPPLLGRGGGRLPDQETFLSLEMSRPSRSEKNRFLTKDSYFSAVAKLGRSWPPTTSDLIVLPALRPSPEGPQ